MARVAIRTSAISEPPVCPTLTPRLARKLSIFCDTFRNATAQSSQIKTLPATASLPEDADLGLDFPFRKG